VTAAVTTIARSPAGRVLEILFLACVPLTLLIGSVSAAVRSNLVAYDFDRAYLPAARLVLHGASPYVPATPAALSSQTAFVYPPIGAFLLAPVAVLPHVAADLVMTALVVLALPALLALLGVRDWRCLGAALLWLPTISAVHLGTLSLPLALGVALVWRLRGRPWRAGILLGLVVAVKLFLWPLVLWLAVTRRYKAALVAAAASGFFLVVPWIPLRGAGLARYPHMLRVLSSLEARRGYSPAALLAKLGWSWQGAQAAGYLVGAAVLVLAVVIGRRESRERESLLLALVASLALTPILWPNYLVVLLVPLGLLRPRFGPVWLAPCILFTLPVLDPRAWQIAALLSLFAGLVVALLWTGVGRRAVYARPASEAATG